MNDTALRNWLAEPRSALATAVAEGVRAHVASLHARNLDFYSYALLPGEIYDIHSLVAVCNTEADIKVARNNDQYRYYRYCVEEWAHWDHDGFTAANAFLAEANDRFESMHSKERGDYVMDDFEVAHANGLLNAVVAGLQAAKAGGAFGRVEPFMVVWISDSDHEIMAESAKRLNSKEVAAEFVHEFG